jgi:hypothetical protein
VANVQQTRAWKQELAITPYLDRVSGIFQRPEHFSQALDRFLSLAAEDAVIAKPIAAANRNAAQDLFGRYLNQACFHHFPSRDCDKKAAKKL